MGKVIDMMTREVLADDADQLRLHDMQLACASIQTQLRDKRAKIAEMSRITGSNCIYIDDDLEARRRLPQESQLARRAIALLETERSELLAQIGEYYMQGVATEDNGIENHPIDFTPPHPQMGN